MPHLKSVKSSVDRAVTVVQPAGTAKGFRFAVAASVEFKLKK